MTHENIVTENINENEKEDRSSLSDIIAEMVGDDSGAISDRFHLPIEPCKTCGASTEFKIVIDGIYQVEPICIDCIVNMMRNEYEKYVRKNATDQDSLEKLLKNDLSLDESICFYTTIGDIVINKIPNCCSSMSDYNLIFACVNGRYFSRHFYTIAGQFDTAFETVRRLLKEICPDNHMPIARR